MTNLKKQLKNNVEQIVCEYYNGIQDYGIEDYPLLTEAELLEYVLDQVYDIKSDGEGSIWTGKGICDNLKFLGNEYIHKTIIEIGYQEEVIKTEEVEEVDESTIQTSIIKRLNAVKNELEAITSESEYLENVSKKIDKQFVDLTLELNNLIEKYKKQVQLNLE